MNAVAHFAALLDGAALRRLARRGHPGATLDIEAARARVIARWHDDLCALLNAMTRGELANVATALRVDPADRSPVLRARLWDAGAALERGAHDVSPALQPRPIVLGGHLVVQAAPRDMFPPSDVFPRALPPPRAPAPPGEEPDSLDELLAAADRALGVRLGRRGRDKGAWGVRAAALLGVAERGGCEPDWRGDVEIKTVPVAREPSGLWRVVEDPAIAMTAAHALAKLQHTLWLARADAPDADATIVSYYLLAWDADIARLARRDLHVRPKGPAGTDQRGVYLRRRFFADAGLLASLNGGDAERGPSRDEPVPTGGAEREPSRDEPVPTGDEEREPSRDEPVPTGDAEREPSRDEPVPTGGAERE